MSIETEPSNLPAQIADAIASVPKAMVPNVVKALDRLLGAAIDVPVAWLEQKKARIDAQTEAYRIVEASIADAVASDAGSDPETIRRAMSVLVRREYRKQTNREAVAAEMVKEIGNHESGTADGTLPPPTATLDEDWLNVFERFAEDASSDRLQGLWGRVLAGEIRKPGRYSTRTLRFLSEFSQADAFIFEGFSKFAFGDAAPKKVVLPSSGSDMSHLIHLEASGLIQGATGLGLARTVRFGEDGFVALEEGQLAIVMKGEPGSIYSQEIVALTALGRELLSLVASRKPIESARAFAFAARTPNIHECHIGERTESALGKSFRLKEALWLKESTHEATAQNASGETSSKRPER